MKKIRKIISLFLILTLALSAAAMSAGAFNLPGQSPDSPLFPGNNGFIVEDPEPEPEIDIPTGATFTAKKTDYYGNPLAGARFVLIDENGDERYFATSDSNGTITFRNVADGNYTLREKSAPDGYKLSDEAYALQLTCGGTADEQILINYENDEALYEPITFVNYALATLNRTDHFAFLKGYPDGGFAPERGITRAEATTMFARLLTRQMDAETAYPTSFSDVPDTHWASDYIGYMEQFGIIKGYADGTFRPDANITRAEFSAICCRFEKLTEGSVTFTDVPESHWAYQYITFAATRGWATGYPDGTFLPERNITRAEVAATTCRLLERSADKDYIRAHESTLPRTFHDVTEKHPDYWYILEATNGHDYTRAADDEIWTNVYP